jgi:hypothetical protein
LWTYILNDSIILIRRRDLFAEKDSIVFSEKAEVHLMNKTRAMSLDTLQEYYFNYCVMITSGTEYSITFTKGTNKKHIDLHCYYQKQVDELIREMNGLIPDKYKISYMSADTKQDCQF